MKDPRNSKLVRQHFDNASGNLSLTELLKAINNYNKEMKTIYPDNKEKVIEVEKLQLDRTIAGLVLQQLSQIQLQIVTTENSYLNSVIKQ